MHPKRTAQQRKTERKMEPMGKAKKNRQAKRKRALEKCSPGEILLQGEDQEKHHGVQAKGAAPRAFWLHGRLAGA
jgi:hypothetical protein